MSTDATTPARAPEPDAPPRPSWWRGRSELLVAALVLGIAGFIAVQTAAIPVPTGTEPPGPRFFPTLVAIFMGAVGLALAVQVALRPARPAQAAEQAPGADAAETGEDAPVRIDWRCLGVVVATMAVFIAILQPVGWLLSAALLFFGIAYALGSRRLLFDAVLSLTFSSLIQLAFVAGLGLNLPAGILGGIF
ncbi:tripartite tricarboxylate transporter TctB family protein [Nocardiopsis tropica]|uniref:Tripartite tricarboxylate transporter TctB family protein n=1 Tax=Nocardiopsis tropica TaxID=109330 RepID=A0ABU7KJV4_9ACTN|nr:tripartite tricarboxylate transporter TctB family protein [Nocardiopsis umidischolae]MEE2049558.1 tripartite tricarboxylate transporter TctB family protein [Nocardiopsis umidischolae]